MASLRDEMQKLPDAPDPEEERALALQRAAALEKLALALAASRSKAINGRAASGIEQEWEEDEEYYEGIDEANRGERRSWRGKPPDQGPLNVVGEAQMSTVFINITRPYVDAAAARIGDMLLPTDDRAWSIRPTPMPELANMAQGKFPDSIARAALLEAGGDKALAQEMMMKAVDRAMAEMREAEDRAQKAQKQIEDWHVECQYHAQVRAVLDDVCKLGTGVLKGPVPVKHRTTAFVDGALVLREEIQPASFRVDPWNFYPDPACGENIHNGNFCWERDDITEKALLDLRGTPWYFDDQIALVLSEGPIKATREAPERPVPDGHNPDRSGQYEIWYYTGRLSREDLEAIGCECPPWAIVSVPVQVTMVNNRIIKVAPNVFDTGDLPYDVMVWQKRAGHWAGIGVARQIRTAQEIVVGAGRNMMDNAGRAGGPQLLVQDGVVVPHDGIYEVTPWKVWRAAQDADTESLENALRFIAVPALTRELMEIIRLALKLAEDVTGLPLLLQGQQGSAPDTVGGMQLMHNNASTVLRRVARLFDDRLTEPHIRRYYAYLMMYGDDSMKGDFQIDARGSSALVQRDIENQAITEMARIVGNPIFGIDPKKWASEWLKSKHLDPKRFEYDDEKWQQIVANMARGPTDPRLAIAQLRAETEERLQQQKQAWESLERSREREQEMLIAMLDAKLAEAGLTADQQKVLSEIKGRISETILKLRAQREMQMAEIKSRVPEVIEPPTEPVGLAKPGKAFIQ